MLKWLLPLLISVQALAGVGDPIGMAADEKAPELANIGIEEKLGTNLDLSLKLYNEQGELVTLGSFFDGKTPVMLSLVYYSCPGLCSLHLNGVVDALKLMDWSVGEKFKVVAVSFDPKEKFEMASKKKDNYIKSYGRHGTEKGWHFLTADQETITALTGSVGFKYRWDDKAQEWAHASAAIVVTPEGKISRYLHGVYFEPPTIKMALGEATNGKIGNLVERMVWYCFKYDQHKSKYSLAVFRIVQIGAFLMIIILSAILISFWRRERRRS